MTISPSTEAIRLQLRSWPEVETYLTHCKGVIVPLGSTEQHGPTGAIGTDALTAEAVALEVGRRTGVLVTPTQAFGMAEHHLDFAGTISLQPATLLAVLHDVVLSLARHGFERIFVINGHGGNIATARAAFAQAYGTATARGLPHPERLRCRLANWFTAAPVMREARQRYGEKEGHHATPSEIALTLHLEPSLVEKQRPLPEPAPAGPIHGPADFRRRHPDGRMGSDPFLASPDHGKTFLDLAATALAEDLTAFLAE
ncbi:creatininase family protein [Synechococcus sp. CCY9201]|uniref:creatininase family protein n=1 Tax=unclassified Synechococcus TaxID=2626047 RepID=UPI0018CF8530|nr:MULTISPECIES: creatininase family protein [unclassified Synechococcus]MEA5422547.1 creatininase family protein [Synechococcus sp. CCY9202]MEA5474486.1 creatininase family protein [Synechococcus sp. CCY9201]QPN61162.1 creatininase family protein [Synechococcus sp. CBW1002]QPN67182.1 creatininase family protein [Synechococcus sp. CBW1006]CAK6701567.1 Creatinine amidohydrolase [Synechococcus sp. CBW1107]